MSKVQKIQDILLWLIFSFSLLFLILYWSRLIPLLYWSKFIPSPLWFFPAGFCLMVLSLILLILSFIQKRFRKTVLSSATLFLCFLVFEIPAMERSLCGQRAEQINKKYNYFYTLIDEYQKNHNGMLPQPSIWCDELMKSNPQIKKSDFQLTFYNRKICFVYNKALENTYSSSLHPNTVLMFTTYELDNGWNLTGDETLFKSLIENAKPFNLPYAMLANGTVVMATKEDFPPTWEPILQTNSSEPNKIALDKSI